MQNHLIRCAASHTCVSLCTVVRRAMCSNEHWLSPVRGVEFWFRNSNFETVLLTYICRTGTKWAPFAQYCTYARIYTSSQVENTIWCHMPWCRCSFDLESKMFQLHRNQIQYFKCHEFICNSKKIYCQSNHAIESEWEREKADIKLCFVWIFNIII